MDLPEKSNTRNSIYLKLGTISHALCPPTHAYIGSLNTKILQIRDEQLPFLKTPARAIFHQWTLQKLSCLLLPLRWTTLLSVSVSKDHLHDLALLPKDSPGFTPFSSALCKFTQLLRLLLFILMLVTGSISGSVQMSQGYEQEVRLHQFCSS